MRIARDEVFMKTALLFSERGTCLRSKVGCVITLNGRIISTGYVGSPPGEPHCLDEGCIISPETGGCVRTIHAEVNAINFLPKLPLKKVRECIVYTTLSPCIDCAKLISEKGFDKVVYLFDYRKKDGLLWLKENHVKVSRYEGRII